MIYCRTYQVIKFWVFCCLEATQKHEFPKFSMRVTVKFKLRIQTKFSFLEYLSRKCLLSDEVKGCLLVRFGHNSHLYHIRMGTEHLNFSSTSQCTTFWQFRPSTSNYNDTLYYNLIQNLSIQHKTSDRAERQFTQLLLSDGGQKKPAGKNPVG